MAESAREFWEDLYGEREQRWSGKVNAVLVREAEGLAPGRALDLGCGEGADALWLAERGWTVTGVDISERALTRARAEAQRRGLDVDWRQQDLVEALPEGPFDLVSAQFLQSPVEFPRIQVLRRAAEQVASGGLLLVVGHAAPPPWSTHRVDPELMPSAVTVAADLALDEGWQVLKAEDVPRRATGPVGDHQHELIDSVVLARRA